MILGFLGFYIAVPPSVTVHPGSKMRIIGQSVTFCCEGAGNPPPDIEWYALLIVAVNKREEWRSYSSWA